MRQYRSCTAISRQTRPSSNKLAQSGYWRIANVTKYGGRHPDVGSAYSRATPGSPSLLFSLLFLNFSLLLGIPFPVIWLLRNSKLSR